MVARLPAIRQPLHHVNHRWTKVSITIQSMSYRNVRIEIGFIKEVETMDGRRTILGV